VEALVDAIVHTGETCDSGLVVLIEAGRVVDLLPPHRVPAGVVRHSLQGDHLAPGFIDAQVNGGGGALFNQTPSVAALGVIAAAHRRGGTTGFLPTIISDQRPVRQAALAAVAAALRPGGVPGVLGLHLEGPHLNPERRGIHPAAVLGPPAEADLQLATGLRVGVTLVTLAPEVVGVAVIRRLAAAGVRVALGHSAAAYDQALAGFAAGATGVTHLYNAMSPLGSREPGLVGAALDQPEVWCGIIADGHHVHDAALRLAWRAKPVGRLFLVSDAMPPVGSEISTFTLGEVPITVEGGRCVDAEGRLAGSAIDLAAAVRHCVRRLGIPLDEALRMASLYPARFLGLAPERGLIVPGAVADLVRFDEALTVREVWVSGCRHSSEGARR